MKKTIAIALLAFIALTLFAFNSTLQTSAAPEPMLANQPLSEYKTRRQKLMEQIKDGVIVLGGAHESDFGEVGRFRQNNFFQYLSGVETPAAALVLVPKGLNGVREFLFIPSRNLARERWTGPQIGPGAEAEAAFGFEKVLPSSELQKIIKQLATTEKNFYTLTPSAKDTTEARNYL
ncbi:MAG TPA: aminopeptidase P N-terminal domain-containing protein, partial [Blastocatellia bacterium]|nr:aminopeptidase P N-terminal domain-containing protein [Blastocatellia bacterium]